MEKMMITLTALVMMLSHMAGTALTVRAAEPTSELTIEVTGFESSQGKAKIALVNSKAAFNGDKAFKAINAKIVDNKVVRKVLVPQGEYAIKIYHDENGNNTLDKMMFGIPKEKYGFSNNARASFGPPEYEAAVFMVDAPKITMAIEVK